MKFEKKYMRINDRPPEEQAEIRRLGGIARGKQLQERKKLKDELIALLSDDDLQQKMCLALIQAVIDKGSASAFAEIRDTIGEKPKDEVVVSMTDTEAREEALDEAMRKLGLKKDDGSGKA